MPITLTGTGTITVISAGWLPDGSIAKADVSATGTADATTFLRGDNTWAAAGGGATALIARNTFTNASTIAITSGFDSSLYDTYLLLLTCTSIGGSGWSSIGIRTSSNGGSSFDSGGSDYTYAGQVSNANTGYGVNNIASMSAHNFAITNTNGDPRGFCLAYTLFRPDDTTSNTRMMAETMFYSSSYSGVARVYCGGERLSNGAVNAFHIFQHGSMTFNGTYQFIGYKKA